MPAPPLDTCATDTQAARLGRTLRLFGLTALLCLLVAAVLTLIPPTAGSFWRNLWFSQWIGLWAAVAVTLLRRLPGLQRLPRRAATALRLAVALPLGYVLGYACAYALLGEPVRVVGLRDYQVAAIVATVLSGGFVTYLAWLRQRLADEAAARLLAQKLAVEAELRMLRAQLEPHMLFNTLANLRSLVDEEPAQARHMIDLLITYLRAALAGSRTDTSTLQAEFAQLAAYLEIMALRLGTRLRYRLELPAALQQARVPPMLLQPLVENALKHGVEPKVGGAELVVSARRDDDGGLLLEVADTGLGLAPGHETEPEAGGYGLAHVRSRLRALYGEGASLQLAPRQPCGTRARVRIPA
ncbi:sensor histidine kinase [Rubrivivax gelatinosus]|uniref:Histidine kinase/HSP90-like ATPase domain-containing protein n=1 Tax=Rubrivivax gelatinosus TaxID=28068 RepID=A0ABS1E052_RUBGE|nr:histidine kinase [Rubrivivax gelatinosus]MBK1715436.1 hypothetical protein [Rubrivivax gelatinosus]